MTLPEPAAPATLITTPPAADSAAPPADAPPAADVPPAAPGGSLLTGGNPDEAPPADAPAADGPPAKDEVKPGAPESYTDFAMPEGISFDAALTDEFKGVAKELNLSQEQAQKLVDFQAKNAQAQSEATIAQFKAGVKAWESETIKSLGANYKQELSIAAKALGQFGTPELTALLDSSGMGSHKEIIGLFLKIGKSISEDSFHEGKKGGGVTDAAKILYPNMK